MTNSGPTTPLGEDQFAAIENALMGSARGRRFLAEYARRNRSADTQVLLDAICKLQDSVGSPAVANDSDRMRHEIIEMSEAIAQTRREIAAIKPPGGADSQIVTATEQLDAIVEATERATGDILSAAETLQDVSMQLRDKGLKAQYCDRLDALSTDIFTACSFQDITGQRTTKVVGVLGFLESRVNAMIGIWGVDEIAFRETRHDEPKPERILLNGPQDEGVALRQGVIDSMLIEAGIPEDEVLFGSEARLDDLLFAPIGETDEPAPAMSPEPDIAFASIAASTVPQPADPGSMVDEDLFGQPEDLSLWALDSTKKSSLFG